MMPKFNLEPTVVTFNAMMEAHGKSNIEDMLKYFEEMKKLDIRPTVKTYNNLIEAYGRNKVLPVHL
jgi:pentatricopeptide repeat protein